MPINKGTQKPADAIVSDSDIENVLGGSLEGLEAEPTKRPDTAVSDVMQLGLNAATALKAAHVNNTLTAASKTATDAMLELKNKMIGVPPEQKIELVKKGLEKIRNTFNSSLSGIPDEARKASEDALEQNMKALTHETNKNYLEESVKTQANQIKLLGDGAVNKAIVSGEKDDLSLRNIKAQYINLLGKEKGELAFGQLEGQVYGGLVNYYLNQNNPKSKAMAKRLLKENSDKMNPSAVKVFSNRLNKADSDFTPSNWDFLSSILAGNIEKGHTPTQKKLLFETRKLAFNKATGTKLMTQKEGEAIVAKFAPNKRARLRTVVTRFVQEFNNQLTNDPMQVYKNFATKDQLAALNAMSPEQIYEKFGVPMTNGDFSSHADVLGSAFRKGGVNGMAKHLAELGVNAADRYRIGNGLRRYLKKNKDKAAKLFGGDNRLILMDIAATGYSGFDNINLQDAIDGGYFKDKLDPNINPEDTDDIRYIAHNSPHGNMILRALQAESAYQATKFFENAEQGAELNTPGSGWGKETFEEYRTRLYKEKAAKAADAINDVDGDQEKARLNIQSEGHSITITDTALALTGTDAPTIKEGIGKSTDIEFVRNNLDKLSKEAQKAVNEEGAYLIFMQDINQTGLYTVVTHSSSGQVVPVTNKDGKQLVFDQFQLAKNKGNVFKDWGFEEKPAPEETNRLDKLTPEQRRSLKKGADEINKQVPQGGFFGNVLEFGRKVAQEVTNAVIPTVYAGTLGDRSAEELQQEADKWGVGPELQEEVVSLQRDTEQGFHAGDELVDLALTGQEPGVNVRDPEKNYTQSRDQFVYEMEWGSKKIEDESELYRDNKTSISTAPGSNIPGPVNGKQSSRLMELNRISKEVGDNNEYKVVMDKKGEAHLKKKAGSKWVEVKNLTQAEAEGFNAFVKEERRDAMLSRMKKHAGVTLEDWKKIPDNLRVALFTGNWQSGKAITPGVSKAIKELASDRDNKDKQARVRIEYMKASVKLLGYFMSTSKAANQNIKLLEGLAGRKFMEIQRMYWIPDQSQDWLYDQASTSILGPIVDDMEQMTPEDATELSEDIIDLIDFAGRRFEKVTGKKRKESKAWKHLVDVFYGQWQRELIKQGAGTDGERARQRRNTRI